MPNPPDRPAKSEATRKADLLQIRLARAERQTFEKAAEVAGISVSAWVRERLRRAATQELEQVGLRAPILAGLYPQE